MPLYVKIKWIIFTCNLHLLSGSIGRAFDVLFMGFLLPMPAFGGIEVLPSAPESGRGGGRLHDSLAGMAHGVRRCLKSERPQNRKPNTTAAMTLALPDERVILLGAGLHQTAVDGSRKARVVDADGEILAVVALALPSRADFAGAGREAVDAVVG